MRRYLRGVLAEADHALSFTWVSAPSVVVVVVYAAWLMVLDGVRG